MKRAVLCTGHTGYSSTEMISATEFPIKSKFILFDGPVTWGVFYRKNEIEPLISILCPENGTHFQ